MQTDKIILTIFWTKCMEKITSRAQQYMNVGGLNSDYKENSEIKIN